MGRRNDLDLILGMIWFLAGFVGFAGQGGFWRWATLAMGSTAALIYFARWIRPADHDPQEEQDGDSVRDE